MTRALRLAQWGLFIVAVSMLGYSGFTLVESWVFQNRENVQLDPLTRRSSLAVPQVPASGLIGRIDIPRLEVSVVVMEGSTSAVLRHAAGHISGTALPGQAGNVGISAHRDTFFRPLRNIRKNDLVEFLTPWGNYRYRVVSTAIVPPADMAVLRQGRAEVLTLVTCYPFYFIGEAPDRFIVRAERVI